MNELRRTIDDLNKELRRLREDYDTATSELSNIKVRHQQDLDNLRYQLMQERTKAMAD